MNLSEVTITIAIRMIQNLLKINCFEYDHNTKLGRKLDRNWRLEGDFIQLNASVIFYNLDFI